jgi:hypothetical protein
VSDLHAELLALRIDNREELHLQHAIAALAAQARECDVPPERMLVVIKRLTNCLALEHLGLWYCLALGERFVQWGIASYYERDNPS